MLTSDDIGDHGILVKKVPLLLLELTKLDQKYQTKATKYTKMLTANIDRVGSLEMQVFEEIPDGEEIDEEAFNAYNKKLTYCYTALKICVYRAEEFLNNAK